MALEMGPNDGRYVVHQQTICPDQNDILTQPPPQGHRRRQRSKYDKTKNTVDKEPKTPDTVEKVTIEEALKALTLTPEGAGSALKTPVSVLQELLSRRGITPTYDLVQIEGAIHEPTFRYRVAFADKDGK